MTSTPPGATDGAPPSARPVRQRSRLVRLPQAARPLLVPLLLSVGVFALGFLARIPLVTRLELGVDQALSSSHVSWFNGVSLGVEKLFGPSGAVLILILASVGIWFLRRTPLDALAWSSMTVAGWVFSLVFKYVVHRPRPEPGLLADPLSPEMDPNSFPSGHVSFVVALVLATFVLLRHRSRSSWILGGGLIVALFVACTRVYVGVHYPIDVLAAFPVALAGVLLWGYVWNRWVAGILLRIPFLERAEGR